MAQEPSSLRDQLPPTRAGEDSRKANSQRGLEKKAGRQKLRHLQRHTISSGSREKSAAAAILAAPLPRH